MYIKTDHSNPHVWLWLIDRPERANGLGTTLTRELGMQLTQLEAKVNTPDGPRCLIIDATPRSGKNGKTWIGGGDLKELALLTTKAQGGEYGASLADFCDRLEQLPIPIIMTIDGSAIGGGAEFALAADLRLGTPDCQFEFRQLRIGLSTGYGGARRLVELVGRAHASRLIWTAHPLKVKEAMDLGLIMEICSNSSALRTRAVAIAMELASLDPQAIATQKRYLNATRLAGDQAQLIKEREWFQSIWGNPTHKQMLDHFNKGK